MHDVCAIHIRRNSVHGHLKLLVVKWLRLSVTVKVRVRARDRNGNFIRLKRDEHLCLVFLALSDVC